MSHYKRPLGPDECCAVCGARLLDGRHVCSPASLAAHDAALRRDPDDEDPPAIPEGRRYADGLFMLGLTDAGEEYDEYDRRSYDRDRHDE